MWTIFKVFIEFVTILLLFYLLGFFGQEACGLSAPWPGIEPTCPALEGEVLTTGLLGKCQASVILTPTSHPVPLQSSPWRKLLFSSERVKILTIESICPILIECQTVCITPLELSSNYRGGQYLPFMWQMGKLRLREAKSPVQAGLSIHARLSLRPVISCFTPHYIRNVGRWLVQESQQAELLELQWTLVGSTWAGLRLMFQTLSTFEML